MPFLTPIRSSWRQGLLLVPVVLLALSGCTGAPPAGARHAVTVAAPPGRLLFHRDAEPHEQPGPLFTSGTDGRNEKQITHPGPDRDGAPDWSPDGKRIVFLRTTHPGLEIEVDNIYTAEPDGSGLKQLSVGEYRAMTGRKIFDSFPVFSPDGRSIAYVHADFVYQYESEGHWDIGIMNSDGTGRRLITHLPANGSVPGAIAWSPDGRRLVYGYDDAVNNRSALFIVGSDGTGNHRITGWTPGIQDETGVDWTPHGDLIAFRRVTDPDAAIGDYYTVHPDGSGLRQVTHLTNKKISRKVSFSPDGRWLAFAASDDGLGAPGDLYYVRVDGRGLHRVKKTPLEETGPAWGPAR